jgi:hypothetical protein
MDAITKQLALLVSLSSGSNSGALVTTNPGIGSNTGSAIIPTGGAPITTGGAIAANNPIGSTVNIPTGNTPPVITPAATIKTSTISYQLEKDLEDLLRSVLNVEDTDSNEVLEALNFSNTRTWTGFMKLVDEDVEDLSTSAPVRGDANARATIGTRHRRELMSFLRLIDKRHKGKDPRAMDIKS